MKKVKIDFFFQINKLLDKKHIYFAQEICENVKCICVFRMWKNNFSGNFACQNLPFILPRKMVEK